MLSYFTGFYSLLQKRDEATGVHVTLYSNSNVWTKVNEIHLNSCGLTDLPRDWLCHSKSDTLLSLGSLVLDEYGSPLQDPWLLAVHPSVPANKNTAGEVGNVHRKPALRGSSRSSSGGGSLEPGGAAEDLAGAQSRFSRGQETHSHTAFPCDPAWGLQRAQKHTCAYSH